MPVDPPHGDIHGVVSFRLVIGSFDDFSIDHLLVIVDSQGPEDCGSLRNKPATLKSLWSEK